MQLKIHKNKQYQLLAKIQQILRNFGKFCGVNKFRSPGDFPAILSSMLPNQTAAHKDVEGTIAGVSYNKRS